jgi:hypothetical protein
MRLLPALLVISAVTSIASAASGTPNQPSLGKSRVTVDQKGDVVQFYGVPMNLKPSDLNRYRYKVRHYWGEGDSYTFYTISAQDGVHLDIEFDDGRLASVRTSSRNALGPRGVGVGSPLSAVEAAWPQGRVTFGIVENEPYVTFEAAEPGFMPNLYYYFDPKDMPSHAFEGEFWDKRADVEAPKNMKVKSIGIFPRQFPEETYDFLAVTTGPCVSGTGMPIDPEQLVACKRMTPKRRYRGTWLVGFDISLFAPAGKPDCTKAMAVAYCAELVGADYFRPHSSKACPKLYRLEFVGQRNALPSSHPSYRIAVDYILADEPLPNPPHKPGECDDNAG